MLETATVPTVLLLGLSLGSCNLVDFFSVSFSFQEQLRLLLGKIVHFHWLQPVSTGRSSSDGSYL